MTKITNKKPAIVKRLFEGMTVLGLLLIFLKIGILILNKFFGWEIPRVSGSFIYTATPLALMVIGTMGLEYVKHKS